MSRFMSMQNYRGDTELVAAIVYGKNDEGKYVPIQVFTVSPEGNGNERRTNEYDFDWCKRDGLSYYHCSGSGFLFYLHPYCDRKAGVPVWWNRELTRPISGRNAHRTIRLSDDTLRRWGMVILDRPMRILGKAMNPFNVEACEGSTEYCSKCDDHLPTDSDSPCKHLRSCNKCGTWNGPGSEPSERCKHGRTE